MIQYLEAITLLKNQAKPLSTETVTGQAMIGRVAAECVTSSMLSPPFHNAAMDGFALSAVDTQHASADHPVLLSIKDTVAAGQMRYHSGAKTAVKIMTGAPLPAGYDTILPVEQAIVSFQQLCVTAPLTSGEHVRYAGEDIQPDDVLIQPGDIITSHHAMVLATIGRSSLLVYRKANIALVTTGAELVHDMDKPLRPGEIYDANMPYLISRLQDQTIINHVESVADHPTVLQEKLSMLLKADPPPDLVITTGAVSRGDFDFIPQVLLEMGAELVFHGVAIRPGKPILFARFQKTAFFGLPGNPISVIVGDEFFIQPYLRTIQTIQTMPPRSLSFARLEHDVVKKPGYRHFLKARVKSLPDATCSVQILPGQESFKVKPLLAANAWAILEEDITMVKSGQIIPVL